MKDGKFPMKQRTKEKANKEISLRSHHSLTPGKVLPQRRSYLTSFTYPASTAVFIHHSRSAWLLILYTVTVCAKQWLNPRSTQSNPKTEVSQVLRQIKVPLNNCHSAHLISTNSPLSEKQTHWGWLKERQQNTTQSDGAS